MKQFNLYLLDTYGVVTAPYLKKLFTSAETDMTCGIRYENDCLLIGNALVNINDEHIVVKDVSYKPTKGLLELLFLKTPNLHRVTEDDLLEYPAILNDTNAHRRNYDAMEFINAIKGYKYKEVIARQFPSGSSGRGLEFKPLFPNVDVKYWNNPNTLEERLQLLKTSEQAGHTGHVAEILEIEEELRTAGIV